MSDRAKSLLVGTDCSGIESPIMAIYNLGVKYVHVFSSDIDRDCEEFINRNFPPLRFYPDIQLRDNREYTKKPLDLYVAGFPCTTFTSLGTRNGFADEIKGTIFFNVYDFIYHNRPKIFILENVKNLVNHDKGNTFHIIMKYLNMLQVDGNNGYNIVHQIMDTNDYGLPQNRSRIFIVGIKKSCQIVDKPFRFPKPTNPNLNISLNSIIQKNLKPLKTFNPPMSFTHSQTKLLQYIYKKYNDIDFTTLPLWILNLNSSISWFSLGK